MSETQIINRETLQHYMEERLMHLEEKLEKEQADLSTSKSYVRIRELDKMIMYFGITLQGR